MKKFPDFLIPRNRSEFKEYKKIENIRILRRRITDYLYSEKKDGFNLSNFKFLFENNTLDTITVNKIIGELKDLGWKIKLAYGNTVMYIYFNDEDIPEIPDVETIDF